MFPVVWIFKRIVSIQAWAKGLGGRAELDESGATVLHMDAHDVRIPSHEEAVEFVLERHDTHGARL